MMMHFKGVYGRKDSVKSVYAAVQYQRVSNGYFPQLHAINVQISNASPMPPRSHKS
jgi:hypothetical protein